MASADYLVHLVGWSAPIIAGQWVVFGRLLGANARAIFGATFLAAGWLSFADGLAIRRGVWTFGAEHLLGPRALGVVPFEEVLFFVITSLLVTQSLVLFLPRRYKRVPPGCRGWRYDGLKVREPARHGVTPPERPPAESTERARS